jgi:hypothetical protein
MAERMDIADRLRWYADGAFSCPDDVLEEAAAEIARLRDERRWIPVGERMPEVKQEVLASSNGEVTCAVYLGDTLFDTPWGVGTSTHWQPLPTPPEGE